MLKVRKKSPVSVSLVLVLSAFLLIMAGCGQRSQTGATDQSKSTASGKPSAAQVKRLSWPTSSGTSGSGYITATTVATMANKYASDYGQPVNITVTTSAGVFENERLLKENNADIILHSSNEIYSSFKGEGNFKGKPNPDLRILFRAYDSYLNIVATEKSGIKTVADLKGKKLGGGPPGSVAYTMGESILGLYGLTYKDMDTRPLSLEEQIQGLKDGSIDACMIVQGINVPAFKDLATTTRVNFISVEKDKWEKLLTLVPKGYYTYGTIPAGTYKGQDKDIQLIGLSVIWATSTRLDANTVYAITKAFFEHKSEVDAAHPLVKDLTIKQASLDLPIPLHEGSEKYFKEKGVIK